MNGDEVTMIEIVKIESKRILSKRTILLSFVMIFLFSACSLYLSLRHYEVLDVNGETITWQENLTHAKTYLQGKAIDWELLSFMRQQENNVYIDEYSIDEIVRLNYGKSVQELTNVEIDNFYQARLSQIRSMLWENRYIQYTQEEKESFLQKASELSEIPYDYAEGWKVLNRDMSTFVPLLILFISVLLFPLFGNDPKVNMTELYRSTRYGKKKLDTARILTALAVGSALYFVGIFVFFVIKMIPFGLNGGMQYIQSNMTTFFSLYNITYLQQFFINAVVGFVALLLDICILILITVVMEKIMNSAVVFAFFWITLLLFDQMYIWQVNHYFANFMPLRLTAFSHYYTGNEVYRFFGISFSVLSWSILLSGMIAGVLLVLAISWQKIKRKRGLY